MGEILVELLRGVGGELAVSVDDTRHGPDAGPWRVLARWPLDPRVLGGLREELAELREMAAGSYSVGWTWRDGELAPEEYVLTDEDGDPVDLAVDASGLVRAALERQAGVWVRAAEETPAVLLEQLLAMVPPRFELDCSYGSRGHLAAWSEDGAHRASAYGSSRSAAIRAATIALLRGRQKCGTCAHWGSPGDEGADRECQADEHHYRRTADSSCPDDWRPAQWLEPEPELPVSPARLVRAALAWADEIGRLGNLHYTTVERELFAAANELRGVEPGPDSEPTESQIARARRVAADTEGTPKSIRRLAVAWLAQHGLELNDGEGGQ